MAEPEVHSLSECPQQWGLGGVTSLPQLPFPHVRTAHNSHLTCIIAVARALVNAGVWASRTTDYQGLCHFLGHTEG